MRNSFENSFTGPAERGLVNEAHFDKDEASSLVNDVDHDLAFNPMSERGRRALRAFILDGLP
jgi:hypothetical protein